MLEKRLSPWGCECPLWNTKGGYLILILITSFQCANQKEIWKELLSHKAITLFKMLGEQVFG